MKKIFFSKKILGWIFYDWAISIYSAVVTTFIFATYFTEKVAINKIVGTADWGKAISIAALIIVVVSPVFGAIADFEGRRKPWLALFTGLMIVSCIMLWFVKPAHTYVHYALAAVILGTVGNEVAMVFYNSMLRDLVSKDHIGRLSGWGWGAGYFGGLTGLTVALFLFLEKGPSFFHLDTGSAEQIRILGPFVAVWILVFSLPIFIFTPDQKKTGNSVFASLKKGILQLGRTLKSIKNYANIFKFLIARMIYTDGLNTVFAFGGIYAAGTFNLSITQVIIFGITMNLAAGLGAILFAWLDDYRGPKFTILVSIAIMVIAGIFMLTTYSVTVFWVVGAILCLCVGPVQSASRSLMIQISPKEIITELFGLYALSGRVTAFLGPWILALVTLHFNSQRIGMSTALCFLVVGAALLGFVKSPHS